ncbi:MAG: polysaccharide pyruvyl transferase family protein [Candidatus Avispirillum sp.]
MKEVLMYHHGSSQNHGCEAIIRTISGIIDEKYPDTHYTVSSLKPEHDKFYIGEQNGKYDFIYSDIMLTRLRALRYYYIGAFGKLFHRIPMFSLLFKDTAEAAKKADLIISVGGDNYSYGTSTGFTTIDNYLRRLCPCSVLWGCSINPELLEGHANKYKLKGLSRFSLITARESITYDALIEHGLKNVKLYPDPAFTLPTAEVTEPMFENGRDIVGVNLSPLICSYESGDGITLRSYTALVRRILDTTDWNVALISHVIKKNTSDSDSAREIMKQFPNEERIRLFDRGDATQIKGCISKCRFFVAARTHASIAAYSNCIPTLVVGYSVKAKGIAKDLFGSWEDYVLPVESLSDENSLCEAFDSLVKNEDSVRNRLESIMPDYIRRAREAGDEIVRLMEECCRG